MQNLVILLFVGLFVFFNILPNTFVYDDELQIVKNPLVWSLGNLPYFFTGGTFFDEGTGQVTSVFYRPMLSTVFAILYSITGAYPFLFHLFQIMLHSVNAFMVFILFRKLFHEKVALVISLIFLVHPINQEAVAYISDLQDILFFFFGMLALYVTASKLQSVKKIILVSLFLLLSMLSKETGILFVPTVLLYAFLFNRQYLNKTFLFAVLATAAVYLYLRFFVANVVKITEAVVPIMNASISERLMTMPAIIAYYLKTFFYPADLALGHSWVVTQPSFENFFLPLIVVVLTAVCIAFLGVQLKKTNKTAFKLYLFFLTWFMFGMLMHIQIIPLDQTVADRWFYFPIVGLLGLLTTAWYGLKVDKRVNKKVLLAFCILVLILLSGRTMVRNTNWINTLTLCQHDLQFVPESYNVQAACGSELLKAGRYEEAKKHLAVAAQLAPNFSSNWYHYGLSYEHTNDIPKAMEYYRKSIQLSKEVNAYVSLAATYLKYENNPQEAKKIVEEGLKHYPTYQRLQLYLAVCEYKLNNKQKAIEIAQKAYQTNQTPEAVYVLTQITNNQEIKLD